MRGSSLLVGHALRIGGGRARRAAAAQVTTFGYAVPGAVVGIGVLLAFAWPRPRAGVRSASRAAPGCWSPARSLGILYAYLVRFLAPAYQAVDASLAKVSPTMTQSALSLGAGPLRVLAPGAPAAGAVRASPWRWCWSSIDAIKELPLVLLLRPFGFTTVSVWVYQLARRTSGRRPPCRRCVIVAAAMVPVFLLFRQVRLVDPHRRDEPG